MITRSIDLVRIFLKCTAKMAKLLYVDKFMIVKVFQEMMSNNSEPNSVVML